VLRNRDVTYSIKVPTKDSTKLSCIADMDESRLGRYRTYRGHAG
jgi:hypothetical protein